MFLDVATGFSGCMHDARALQHTALFRRGRQGEIYQNYPIKLITSQLNLYWQEIGPTLFQHG